MNITCCRIISCTLQLYVLVLRIVRFQIFFSFVFEAFSKKEAGGRHFTTGDPHLHCNSFVCICTVHNVKSLSIIKSKSKLLRALAFYLTTLGLVLHSLFASSILLLLMGGRGNMLEANFSLVFSSSVRSIESVIDRYKEERQY